MDHQSTKKGRLEVICGSMFSGKSEELIRRLKRTKIARKATVAFKHSLDDRTEIDYVISHNGSKIKAYPVDNALMIPNLVSEEIEVVGIDESQFFSHELIDIVLQLIDSGKDVIIAGLNLDFRAIPFGPMPTLMALADKITKLSAVCIICGEDAYFSQRLVNGEPAKYNDPLIKVGANEAYQARCRGCYIIDKRTQWQSSL